MASAPPPPPPSPVRDRLQVALRDAMKARDRAAVNVLRSTLSAIDNAEAVAPMDAGAADSQVVAGAVDGVGAAEVARRELSEDDVAAIVTTEIAELHDAALTYDANGTPDRAEALRAGAAVLTEVLRGPTGS